MDGIKINVITLGASGVGKTSIIRRIKDGTFQELYTVTIGVEFFSIEKIYEKKNIKFSLNFHDTNGQESLQGLIPIQYIRNSHVVLLVFSNIDTLNDIKDRWYSFYKENTNINNPKFILVGNKSDLFGNQRGEIVKQGTLFSDEIDALFMTCSAKNTDNMDNLERYIDKEAKRYIDEYEKMLSNVKIKKSLTIEKKDIKKYEDKIKKDNNEKKKCC